MSESVASGTPTTLRQVARLAGVSPSTVSRVLQDSPRISPQTKARIRSILEAHGYIPTGPTGEEGELGLGRTRGAAAKNPRSLTATPTVGVLVANPTGGLSGDHFFTDVVQGILHFAQERLHVLVSSLDGRWTPGAELPRMVREHRINGLLIGGVPIADRLIEALLGTDIPCVFIGRYLGDRQPMYFVTPDNFSGGEAVGLHLAACGYQSVYFLGGELSIRTFADRLRGFRAGLSQAGAQLPDEHVLEGGIDREAGRRLAAALLANPAPGRIGIFAATDWLAAGALQTCHEAGIPVPQQVGIVGYSNLDLAAHLTPGLTTVRVERQLLGVYAARLLMDRLAGTATQPVGITLQPRLVVRGSTTKELIVGCASPSSP